MCVCVCVHVFVCVYKMHSATWLFPKTSEERNVCEKRGTAVVQREATLPSSGVQLLHRHTCCDTVEEDLLLVE